MPNSRQGMLEDVLEDIEDGLVIPVLGEDLFRVEVNNGTRSLNAELARRCGEKLGLPRCSSLNELFCQYPESLGPREQLYREIRRVRRDLHILPPDWLLAFVKISTIKLFVTTSFDDIPLSALSIAHGIEPDVRAYALTGQIASMDLDRPYEELDRPTLYYLFGRLSGAYDYVASDQDALEYVGILQDRSYQPPLLFDALRKQNLLLLGCNFPDWLTRFFLRTVKNQGTNSSRSKNEYLVDTTFESAGPLVAFLRHFRESSRILTGDPIAFVQDLCELWETRHPTTVERSLVETLPPQLAGNEEKNGVFLSYASEDTSVAEQLANALRDKNVPVWFDKRKLQIGDAWDDKISRALRHCSYFVPVISKNTQERERAYFWREWNLAADRSLSFNPSTPFIIPIIIGDLEIDKLKVPAAFPTRQAGRLIGQNGLDQFVEAIVELTKQHIVGCIR